MWTCKGAAGDSESNKRGYYLQFAEHSVDVNSTYLRGILTKSYNLDEAELNQLSTDALLELLAPVLQI